MPEKRKKMTQLGILFTVCGALLLVLLFGMLLLQYRTVESELDRMLMESLTAHTAEAGEGAEYLLNYTETALKNANLLLQEEHRAPEKSWVDPVVRTFNLVDDRMDLSYLDRGELTDGIWGSQSAELSRKVLAGDIVTSGLISDSEKGAYYVVTLCPVEWEGGVAGVLQAKVDADTLLHQGKHSTFFHSVNSVIAGEDGRVVYGSSPKSAGLALAELGAENDITEQEAQTFTAAYQENQAGSFYYDPPGGRCYVAWAQAGRNGWRVVQFSRSPNVQIERNTMMQTVVTLASLVVCAALAALVWRQRAKLAAERLRYSTLAEFKDTLIFEYDCRSGSLEFTSNAMDTLELDTPRLKNATDPDNDLPVFHPDDIENVRRALQGTGHMIPDEIEHDRVRLKRRDGSYSWYRSQYKAVFDAEGKPVRLIGTLTDISAQIDREIELRNQAQQDPLTGVYNRAGVKLINARLEQISRGVLFMLDLDNFKSVNDNYGHAAGDRLLTAIGGVLRDAFRSDDIVARVGGDEFVAFLSGSDSRSTAEQKGQELLERVRRLQVDGIPAQISVSVGAASAPEHGRTYEALSQVADKALYEVKKNGKGGFLMK